MQNNDASYSCTHQPKRSGHSSMGPVIQGCKGTGGQEPVPSEECPDLGRQRVDFSHPSLLYRSRHGGGVKQAIARAVGLKHGVRPTVLDATAGLGRDAFILASLGCSVTLVERHPELAAMLRNALHDAAYHPEAAQIASRMHLVEADSKAYMQQLAETERPDVVYLDPMFPERKKHAKVKKEMAFLQSLLGNQPEDLDELLSMSLRTATKRVVMKRPRLAPVVGDRSPDFSLAGKSCRFDVWLTHC